MALWLTQTETRTKRLSMPPSPPRTNTAPSRPSVRTAGALAERGGLGGRRGVHLDEGFLRLQRQPRPRARTGASASKPRNSAASSSPSTPTASPAAQAIARMLRIISSRWSHPSGGGRCPTSHLPGRLLRRPAHRAGDGEPDGAAEHGGLRPQVGQRRRRASAGAWERGDFPGGPVPDGFEGHRRGRADRSARPGRGSRSSP